MDITWMIVAVVLCAGLLRSADAGCMEDMAQEFMNCAQGYSTFIANSGGDIQKICSPQGLAKMNCVTDILARCPDFAQGENQALNSVKDMNKNCALINGGGGGGAGGGGAGGGGAGGGMNPACMKIQECTKRMAGMGGMQPPAGNSRGNMAGKDTLGFGALQPMISMLCGPTKEMFDCIDRVSGDCPKMLDSMKQNMGSSSGMPGMTYERMRALIKKSCSSMPSDLGTNKCVMDKLQISSNNECVKEATEGIDTPSCSELSNVVGCLSLDDCGTEYDMAVRQSMSAIYSAAQNKECDLTSDSYRLRASIFTIITAVLLLIKLI